MKTAICDHRMPKKALKELEKYCDRIVLLPSFKKLAEPVSAHPDMLIFPCPEQRILFTHKDYLSIAEYELGCLKFNILAIEEKAERDYPRDILLNAAVVGENLIGRLAYISRSVMSYAQSRDMELIDVKQGYAKCSICTVSENALITADPSITKAAKLGGIDVLDISEDGIFLEGYDHGFIGGASGTDGERVFFCGNILLHKDGERIVDFCRKHAKEAVSLSDEPLYDVGTILFV